MGMHKTIQMDITMTDPLWPTSVVNEIQRVMEEGEAAGKRDWDKQSATEHLIRARRHIAKHFSGDTSEDHIGHAFTRLMMAVAISHGYLEAPDA